VRGQKSLVITGIFPLTRISSLRFASLGIRDLPLVGLSQMSKEVEEELLLPCSEFHFAPYGSIIGVRPQDVERDAAHDAKIFRSVILARAGVVLVEDDIERPVQVIFYAPIRARHFEHSLRRQ